MITFNEVKMENENVYVAVPTHIAKELCWHLEQACIWHKYYPPGIIEGRMLPEGERFADASGEISHITDEDILSTMKMFGIWGEGVLHTGIILSHLPKQELLEKALYLHENGNDEDYRKYEEEMNRRALRYYEETYPDSDDCPIYVQDEEEADNL